MSNLFFSLQLREQSLLEHDILLNKLAIFGAFSSLMQYMIFCLIPLRIKLIFGDWFLENFED